MRKTVFISLLFLSISCKKEITEIRYYPTEQLFSDKTSEVIGLDTTRLNFKQITDKSGGYFHNNKHVIVGFNDNSIKKRMSLFHYGGGLVKYKNVLPINSDSILIDKKYPIKDLKRILKRHYLNKGKVLRYSDSPQKAFIEIRLDTNSTGKELKNVLIKLTRSFDEVRKEIDDSIQLKVVLRYWLVPPPPPLPNKF